MAFIAWDDSYDVGVEKLNNDHKELINLVNKLHLGLVAGDSVDALSKVLSGLVDYTKKHFKSEEFLLGQYKYPEFEKHKLEHNKLIEQVADFDERLKAGTSSFSIELMSFLKDWLLDHIKGVDMKYKDFFKANNVK